MKFAIVNSEYLTNYIINQKSEVEKAISAYMATDERFGMMSLLGIHTFEKSRAAFKVNSMTLGESTITLDIDFLNNNHGLLLRDLLNYGVEFYMSLSMTFTDTVEIHYPLLLPINYEI